ncbi:hypothetical protein BDR07DRAFT_1381220 [Suillus spraguei]|nr:hypothetical protein BDR07DRAFT_1381220 [Suillus spraguei]
MEDIKGFDSATSGTRARQQATDTMRARDTNPSTTAQMNYPGCVTPSRKLIKSQNRNQLPQRQGEDQLSNLPHISKSFRYLPALMELKLRMQCTSPQIQDQYTRPLTHTEESLRKRENDQTVEPQITVLAGISFPRTVTSGFATCGCVRPIRSYPLIPEHSSGLHNLAL